MSAHSSLGRAGVGLEPFEPRERDGIGRRFGAREPEPRPHAQKREHAQPRAEARRATGWQHVIRSDAIVAHDLCRGFAQKDRAIVLQRSLVGGSLSREDLQVLGRERVDDAESFLVRSADHGAAVGQARTRGGGR